MGNYLTFDASMPSGPESKGDIYQRTCVPCVNFIPAMLTGTAISYKISVHDKIYFSVVHC